MGPIPYPMVQHLIVRWETKFKNSSFYSSRENCDTNFTKDIMELRYSIQFISVQRHFCKTRSVEHGRQNGRAHCQNKYTHTKFCTLFLTSPL